MDNNNINFKELWQSQTSPPQQSSEELTSKMKQLKSSNIRKMFLTTFLFAATSCFMIWIWVTFQPEIFTTKLGIMLVILAMAIYGVSLNQQHPLLKKIDEANSNAEYLQNLLAVKKQQQFLQTTMMSLYYILLSAGLALYLYEYASMMSDYWGIFAYAATFAWIAFTWFYIRPRQAKKQNSKMDEMITHFQALNQQLEV
jgi:membrane protein YdbS with pleckstrin-like domain